MANAAVTGVKRRILPSIFKFRVRATTTTTTTSEADATRRVTDVVSLTLILPVITFFRFEGARLQPPETRLRRGAFPKNLFVRRRSSFLAYVDISRTRAHLCAPRHVFACHESCHVILSLYKGVGLASRRIPARLPSIMIGTLRANFLPATRDAFSVCAERPEIQPRRIWHRVQCPERERERKRHVIVSIALCNRVSWSKALYQEATLRLQSFPRLIYYSALWKGARAASHSTIEG